MSDKTFKIAGVSKLKGSFKVRFANDMTRVKVLAKTGHTEIELVELPKAMTKPELVTFLKGSELYQRAEFRAAIDAADEKYNTAGTVKVAGVKVKAPAKAPTTKAKATA
jgi:hypothetical protein